MAMPECLRESRLLVIGGSSGIGEATAAQAAQAGARVTIASRSGTRLSAALERLPGGVASARLDVTDPAAVDAFFAGAPAWDHVILSGSATLSASVGELPLPDARAAMDSKFWGAYHIARSARVQDGGSITFVSGVYSVRPVPSAVLQGAINAAIDALARGLALELAPRVRVNVVSPSTTATPLWDRLGEAGRAHKLAQVAARLPLARVAQPEDIASAILFVACNPFATGSVVLIDGGDSLV
mgnify:CR=1 FL=1